mmetsp:Transcript_3660/g.7818  ORF Transcript_3660/g.7818 Transcript_3660/m.7818 type:complete len:110 (+) Transcript_3660:503-832(+)
MIPGPQRARRAPLLGEHAVKHEPSRSGSVLSRESGDERRRVEGLVGEMQRAGDVPSVPIGSPHVNDDDTSRSLEKRIPELRVRSAFEGLECHALSEKARGAMSWCSVLC